jgi:hypothetical protein
LRANENFRGALLAAEILADTGEALAGAVVGPDADELNLDGGGERNEGEGKGEREGGAEAHEARTRRPAGPAQGERRFIRQVADCVPVSGQA